MFRTFRHRLLFWFLFFISLGGIILALTLNYLKQVEQLHNQQLLLQEAQISLRASVEAQQYFFSYDSKNPDFYSTGQGEYSAVYATANRTTEALLDSVSFDQNAELQKNLDSLRLHLAQIQPAFTELEELVFKRGYRDYGLVGRMRQVAHQLEEKDDLPKEDLLYLRRHEKDFIIRNDTVYKLRFKGRVRLIQQDIGRNPTLTSGQKENLLSDLDLYASRFDSLVAFDIHMGLKNNTALKYTLDQRISSTEAEFDKLYELARIWLERRNQSIRLLYMGIAGLTLLFSMLISSWIAGLITKPLTELTEHITHFVNSNFTLETDHPVATTKDEIGSLTRNFSHLKDEVINRLKFFKEKVDERTMELAQANSRLKRISEANSRFVPDEFLQYLNKRGIEEIELGDHVAQEMTVLFTDIRDFTQLSESMTPAENFAFINSYLQGIVPIIQRNGGFIDKFIGDSVMALYPDRTEGALQTAFDIEHFLIEFNEPRLAKGERPILAGTGVHSGSLILGTIGHQERLETTVISDAVNTAARIEGLTKFYGISIIGTESAIAQLSRPELFPHRFIDRVKVKGKEKTVEVFEFLSRKDQAKLAYLEEYQEAVQFYKQKEYHKALTILNELKRRNPEDNAMLFFCERIQNLLDGDDGGDSIDYTEMTTK